MAGMIRIGAMMVAGGMALSLAACSRTSDGTIVVPTPAKVPALNLEPAKRLVPPWMKREAEPVEARNFPPPPPVRSPRRRTAEPPVVRSNSGNLSCRNVSESGGRVRMVCE